MASTPSRRTTLAAVAGGVASLVVSTAVTLLILPAVYPLLNRGR